MVLSWGVFWKFCKLSFVEKAEKFLFDVPYLLLSLLQNLKFVDKILLPFFSTLVVLDKAQAIMKIVISYLNFHTVFEIIYNIVFGSYILFP